VRVYRRRHPQRPCGRDVAAGRWATGADSLVTTGRSLVAIHDWTFLLGPGWVVGVGNGLILGYLMFPSGLVPRGMAMLGLIGGPLIITSGTAVLFGGIEAGSSAQLIATIPEFVWEFVARHLPRRQGVQALFTTTGEPRVSLVDEGSPAMVGAAK
jgi:hypothetical protein